MIERGANRQPADQAQRDAALDLRRSFIVQAPAGSGKTELLTQRLLKLLGAVERPERVLAITFTRRATQEMRDRILRRLRQAASGQPVAAHERRAVDFARAVLDNGRRNGWDLLENPARLRILTIDSLCAQLLQRSADHGLVISGLRLVEDADPLHRLAVRALFEDLDQPQVNEVPLPASPADGLHQSLVRVLSHLDGDAVRAEELLAGMLKIRDQWVPLLSEPPGAMRAVLHDRQRAELDSLIEALGAERWREACGIVSQLGAAVADPQSPAARCAALQVNPDDPEAAVRQAYWLCQLLTTSENKPRGRTGIRKSLFPGIPAALEPQVLALSAIYQDWHDDEGARDAIARMADAPPLDDAISSDELLQDLTALLKLLLAELTLVMAEEGKADFHAVAQAALQSLGGEGDEASAVLLAEDQRLEHLLVDEFQDTSHTQHRLLRKLTDGWAAGDGRSLFLVGDPMQSIYRFREADVGLFTRVVRQRRLGQVPLEPLALSVNFRSRAEIVAFANQHFARLFPAEDRADSGAVAYHAAVAEHGAGGAVEAHALAPEDSDQEEARRVAALIRASLAEDAAWEIAVLVRSRKHLGAISRELIRAGMAFDAVRVDPLASRPVVQDLLAITRALAHPADRAAWLALLRAPWCALRLADLHRVAGDDRDADLLQRIRDAVAEGVLPPEERQRLRQFGEVLSTAEALAASHGLTGRVEFAWLALGGPRCYAGSEELENAATFLSLLRQVEQEGPIELVERLEQGLENLYARGAPSRVKLMPIHQAKGLEFDVVIMPGLHYGVRGSEARLLMLQQFTLSGPEDADGVMMAPVRARWHEGPSLYRYLSKVDSERQGFESLRVLYVAATRAKSRLHLVGRFRRTGNDELVAPANTFLDWLAPAFADAVAARQAQPAAVEAAALIPPALPLLRLSELPDFGLVAPAHAAPVRWPALPGRDAAAVGEALHRLFELIHDHPDFDAARSWAGRIAANGVALDSLLLSTGADRAALPRLRARLRALLQQALDSAIASQLLGRAEASASFSELPLLVRDGCRLTRHVIDLAWQDAGGHWHIVDFKTAADGAATREAWQSQLGRYATLLQRLTGSAPVSLGVYAAAQGVVLPLAAEGASRAAPGSGQADIADEDSSKLPQPPE